MSGPDDSPTHADAPPVLDGSAIRLRDLDAHDVNEFYARQRHAEPARPDG